MKLLYAAGLAGTALIAPLAAVAQTHPATTNAPTAASPAKPAMTNGVVRKVDKASGSLVIAHEPLTNLGMGKMTMSFLVKDRKWLDQVKEGTPIRFVAEDVKGELTVVALEPVK
jgi:Cu(I)/Ag(I) efflux system protein CusF